MNRKLHNTFLGLTASTAMLSLALALGAPAAQPEPHPMLAAAIEAEVLEALADAGIEVEQAGHAAEAARAAASAITGSDASGDADGGHRRNRHSVVVPYFSFAPRG